MSVVLNPVTTSATPGLVTLAQATAALADYGLTANQTAQLPGLIAAASRAIRKQCNRFFNRCPSSDTTLPWLDGLYTVDWPSRTLILRQYPVNRIKRVRTNPVPVLTVTNSDTTTNQQATATLSLTGVADVADLPPTAASLELWRVASGVESDLALALSNYPTLAALAAAISAQGGGWSASVASGYERWPTADLRSGQGPQPALGADAGPGFVVHTADVPARLDAQAGILTLTDAISDPFASPRFGLYLDTDVDDVSLYGGPQGVRVIYDAGWDVVPEDIQQATVETVKAQLERFKTDATLGSETDGAYSWSVAPEVLALPKSVLQTIAPYRNRRA